MCRIRAGRTERNDEAKKIAKVICKDRRRNVREISDLSDLSKSR